MFARFKFNGIRSRTGKNLPVFCNVLIINGMSLVMFASIVIFHRVFP